MTTTEQRLGQNPPPEGWSAPDNRGIVKFTTYDQGRIHGKPEPSPDGYEVFFVAVVGGVYTRWSYRPLAAVEVCS